MNSGFCVSTVLEIRKANTKVDRSGLGSCFAQGTTPFLANLSGCTIDGDVDRTFYALLRVVTRTVYSCCDTCLEISRWRMMLSMNRAVEIANDVCT